MNDADADMLDQTAIRTLFDDLGENTARKLLSAAEADIATLAQQLLDACAARDEEVQHSARHSLAGVCTNFGAAALLAIAAEDLSSEAARERFRSHSRMTVTALRAIAQE